MQHSGDFLCYTTRFIKINNRWIPLVQEPLVSLRGDARFAYGEAGKILRGIDRQIPRGKVVAIMGGSGCGKTPASAYWRPASGFPGEVRVADKVLNDLHKGGSVWQQQAHGHAVPVRRAVHRMRCSTTWRS